jgi:hypothetical protein
MIAEHRSLALRNEVIDLVAGAWQTQVAGAAVELGIPDLLAQGPVAIAELATKTGGAVEPMRRLLRAMCSLDLALQVGNDRFDLTDRGTLLRRDAEGSLAMLAQSWAGRRWQSFGQLVQSVRSGDPIAAGFSTASPDPAVGIAAGKAQVARTRLPAKEIAHAYDFGRFDRVLDVGGGHGAMLAAILAEHPALEGAVFDLPHHAPQTAAYLADEGVADRGAFIGGSFFDAVPTGYDCLILKSILHDWPDEECRALLRSCAMSLTAPGTLLVVEEVLPEIATGDPGIRSAFRTDLTMLVSTGGRERTLLEYERLFRHAGFTINRVLSNASEFQVIELCRDRDWHETADG